MPDYSTVETCLAAVQKDGWAIECIPVEMLTYEICLAAVQQDGATIGLVSKLRAEFSP